MEKKSQDLAWACLPKEVRDEIKERYSGWNKVIGFETECILYDEMFGAHNLTSDIEPEEMLMVERKEVQSIFTRYNNKHWASNEEEQYGAELVCSVFEELFGDKCLPDKPLEEKAKEIVDTIKDDIENPIQVPETMLMPDKEEQPKPKFKIEDKVYQTTGYDRLTEYTIKKVYIDKSRGFVYDIQGLIRISGVEEKDLCYSCQNPYTEEKKPDLNNTLEHELEQTSVQVGQPSVQVENNPQPKFNPENNQAMGKAIPNDVYLFNVALNIDLDIPIYLNEGAFGRDENKVQEAYFTKEKIEELKREIIEKIIQSENPFDIYCRDEDGGYDVTEEMIFKG